MSQEESVPEKEPVKLEIEFANKIAAQNFLHWLCNRGEQWYWQDMEVREDWDKNPNITAVSFDYHTANDGNFGPKVIAKCGRMDEQ